METHVNGLLLPNIDGYRIIADPTFPMIAQHGGIAAYVTVKYFATGIRFSKCTLSFSLDTLREYCFIGVYIYPIDSINFSNSEFGILSEELSFWLNRGITPYIGGDFNARLGNIGELSAKTLKWRYGDNIDAVKNQHGDALAGICELHKILPLNHCNYLKNAWPGKFTYSKGGKQSQIDFCLTSRKGRMNVRNFQIIEHGWHVSDHLPLSISLCLPCIINTNSLLARAIELTTEHNIYKPLRTYTFKFDYNIACDEFRENQRYIEGCLNSGSPDIIINEIENAIKPIILKNKTKNLHNPSMDYLEEDAANKQCDELYDIFTCKVSEQTCSQEELAIIYENYQNARNNLNGIIIKQQEIKYRSVIDNGDERKLWNEINWSGIHKEKQIDNSLPIQVISDYFEKLYEPLNNSEHVEMDSLETQTYMPITDDPITETEMLVAQREMKKGGYDFSLDVLSMLMQVASPALLILLNLIFYVAYPVRLAISLLCAIPKKGNLKLLTNYRGIQIQPLLAILYDRIIANRLILWANTNEEQTAFKKGKSTLDQIFLLRTIISLAKQTDVTLYISFFDLAKAFDKVSRPLLLKSLIKKGIGAAMFYAIKAMYSFTRCILRSGLKLSELFPTFTGIKQGAPSSVILFIIFMDEFITDLRKRCIKEDLIGELHMLLHADDTVILSLQRNLFITKCNILISLFHEKRLGLNLGKSGFLVINPKSHEDRAPIKLESGWLKYCNSVVYLGVTFSDIGSTYNDINLHASLKGKSVYIKLANFIRNNKYAPITVKMKVLRSCLLSSILYGCEAWSSSSLDRIETLYRKAIKIVFSMDMKTPNEIVYVESGLIQLKAEVYKRQFKMWQQLADNIYNGSSVSQVYLLAIKKNTFFLRHYRGLLERFTNANKCYTFYTEEFLLSTKHKLQNRAQTNAYGSTNIYTVLNSKLLSPVYYRSYVLTERNRLILTKYRTGSHYLKIKTGSYQRKPIEERLCSCKSIQTLQHVIFECELTSTIRHRNFPCTIEEFFDKPDYAATTLRKIEKLLNLR